MPLRRTRATVIRTYRVGEADKIAVFFAPELGKIRGLARGARRSRSRFGGSLEVGTEVELTFFEKEGQDLVSVDRCDIIRSGFTQWADPVLACTLAYFADLVDAFAPEREPNSKLYRLLSAAIEALDGGGEPIRTARYFEAWLLRLGGLYPRRGSCATCGALLVREGARYQIEEHRLTCGRCAPGGIPLSPETLAFVGRIWQEPPQTLAAPTSPRVLDELSVFHRKLIGQELDKELPSYRVLEDLLRGERER